jgi:hypothetical protein
MSISIDSANLLIISLIGLVATLILYLNLTKVQSFLQSEMDKDSQTTRDWDRENPLLKENEYGEISFNVMNPPKEGEEMRILRFRFEQIKEYRGVVSQAKTLMFILFIICAAGVGWSIGTW